MAKRRRRGSLAASSSYRYGYECRPRTGCTVWLVSSSTGDKKDPVEVGLSRRAAASLARKLNRRYGY